MHELSLFAQIPLARHEQLLNILAGVAAMQPQPVFDRHIIYKPLREPEEPGSHIKRGGNQTVTQKQTKTVAAKDLYYTRLVQELDKEDFQQPQSKSKVTGNNAKDSKWSFRFWDVPETGDRGVLVRFTSTTDLVSGDPLEYMTGLGNTFVTEYYNEGHRFVYENIVIVLHRVLRVPGAGALATSPVTTLPAYDTLKPVDPSDSYILQAYIRVEDLSSPAILDQGIAELTKFKNLMKGCVELEVPDRLVFDTRVKWQPTPAAQVGVH